MSWISNPCNKLSQLKLLKIFEQGKLGSNREQQTFAQYQFINITQNCVFLVRAYSKYLKLNYKTYFLYTINERNI